MHSFISINNVQHKATICTNILCHNYLVRAPKYFHCKNTTIKYDHLFINNKAYLLCFFTTLRKKIKLETQMSLYCSPDYSCS